MENYTIDYVAEQLVKNAYNRKPVSICFDGISLFNTKYIKKLFKNQTDIDKVKIEIIKCFEELSTQRNIMNDSGKKINKRSKIDFIRNVEGSVFINTLPDDTIYDAAFKYFCAKRQGLSCKIIFKGQVLPNSFKSIDEVIDYYNQSTGSIVNKKTNIQESIIELSNKGISELMEIYNTNKKISNNCETTFKISANNDNREVIISTVDEKLGIRKTNKISYNNSNMFDSNIKDDLISKVINSGSILVQFKKDNNNYEAEYEDGTTLVINGYSSDEIELIHHKINDVNKQLLASEQLAKTCNISKLINEETKNKGFVEALFMGGLLVFLLVIAIILVIAMLNK